MTPESTSQVSLGRDVFVSYASHDAAVANSLVENLEEHGIKCWIAPRDVTPGSQYADEIVGAINDSKVLVLVLSEHAVGSPHVGRELERAASKRRRIIVLRTDGKPLTRSFEYFLSESQWIAARSLDDITEEDFDRTVVVNLKSVFLCTQAVLPGMRARRWGRVVNLSSIGARIGAGSVSIAYGASKAGVEGLTRAYALRLAASGVTVNAVAPGLVDTDMGKPLMEAGVATRIPVGRAGTGDEIAQAVTFLVGNGYVTGQTIAVNGGSLFS
jgi:NAD(P)-dependent dehydrogenase (short-subunit alcohol dehydrogenase family)